MKLKTVGLILTLTVATILAAGISYAYTEEQRWVDMSEDSVAYPKPIDAAIGSYWYSRSIIFSSSIPNVEVTGFRINSDSQVTVTLRYSGEGFAPATTVIVSTAGFPIPYPYPYPSPYTLNAPEVKPEANQTLPSVESGMEIRPIPPEWYPYPSLIGSTFKGEGWRSPADVTLNLVGEGSVYDATTISITLIPFTG